MATKCGMIRNLIINYLIFIGSILSICSCSFDNQINKEALKVSQEKINIRRYETDLFKIDTTQLQNELSGLQKEFLPFLNVDLTDTNNLIQVQKFITDTLIRSIFQETIRQYASLQFLEDELTMAFKHIRYYFPNWTPPKVYTYISGLNYETPVGYNGTDLIIALDMYLGQDFETYHKMSFPVYKINRMIRECIVADCIREIISTMFMHEFLSVHLLDKIIYEGRLLYMMDLFIPWINEKYKIGFTQEQVEWCRSNESKMWAYFLENELLFTSDPLIIKRFTNEGPFTTAFHNDSPARAAVWVGWQIVYSYMKNNPDVSVVQLSTQKDSQEILNASGYKPKRFGFKSRL